MKKGYALIIIVLFALIMSGGVTPPRENSGKVNKDLIRIHVLANSDSEDDQALKYMVKDAIVKEMANKFSSSESIDESREILLANLPQVENIASSTLKGLGLDYDVNAQYGRFFFPTKYYGNFSLPAGEYEAVRVVIGEGKGANWWCVLFPPLCFVTTDDSKELSKVKSGYPVNAQKEFKKDEFRVSLKIVEVIKNSFTTLARLFR